MPRLRCPECRHKFNTSKNEGRVRCPECDERFEPDWDEVNDREPERREDADDEPPRPRVKVRPRKTGSSNTALIVAGLVFFLLFLGAIGFGAYWALGALADLHHLQPARRLLLDISPGTPTAEEQTILGMRMKAYGVELSRGSWVIAWADVPPGTSLSLRGAVDGISNYMDGSINHLDSKGDLAANGYIEFEIAVRKPTKGFASGRVMVVNGRFYQFFALGSNTSLSNSDVRKFIDSFKLTDGDFPWNSTETKPQARNNPQPGPKTNPKKANPKTGGWAPDPKDVAAADEEILGVGFDPKKTDTASAGGILVGLEVGLAPFFDYDIVGTLKPIYRTGKTETPGQHYGTDEKNGVVKLLAKPGYAIGAITAKTGLGIDGVSVTFMRIDGDHLDPDDAYESEWVGGMGGGGPRRITGKGATVTGLIVREGTERVSAVGLVFKHK